MHELNSFFEGFPDSHKIFDALRLLIEEMGAAEMRITKSQIAFRQKRTIAVVWIPAKYLKGKSAPLVVTFSFHSLDSSHRWKEIVRTSQNRYTHHLELFSTVEIDEDVKNWISRAIAEAK